MYAYQWSHGQVFDLNKSQVQTHRARLRKIGIDIAEVCDMTKHSPVFIKRATEIEVSDLQIPDWYQRPGVANLRLVA